MYLELEKMYLLRLRKTLLCNSFYYTIFIIAIIITIFSLLQKRTSSYTEDTTTITGIITKITKKENQTTYEIKGKEKVIGYGKEKETLNLGDKVEIIGEFQRPQTNTNEYLFNYKEYLERNKIYFLVQIESIKRIKKNKNIYYFIKQKVINRLNKNPYLHTFLLGDKSLLKDDVVRSFQENGISHLFAISGMHITLLSSLLKKILKKFLREEQVYKGVVGVLIFYLLLVGFSPSIVRGVLFYILFEGNKIYYFYIKKENLFLLILSISLLLNPFYIYDVGFQYSYIISYSLLKTSDHLTSNSKIGSLFKVSICSFLVSIPITLKSFYQLNFLSILYNLIYVPFVSIILFPMSLLVFLIKPLEPIYNFLIILLEESSLFLGKIKVGKLLWKRLPLIIYMLYFILIFFYINTKKKKIIYLFLTILMIHYLIPYVDQTEYIKMIDVGQGDCILMHSNHKNVLIDTGGKMSYRGEDSKIFHNIIKPILKSEGIGKLDYLIITHGDYDHIGESINLVNNLKVEKVIFNCGSYNNLEEKLISVLEKKKIDYYSCIKEINIGNNKLYFLNTKEYDNENDNSSIIYTELKKYKFLFMGDASVVTEKEILDMYSISNIDVLKVGHHGSKTSSSEEFINVIHPNYSIISVGENNKYNHPNSEALKNLENSTIYRTDINGSITVKIKKNKLKIETVLS